MHAFIDSSDSLHWQVQNVLAALTCFKNRGEKENSFLSFAVYAFTAPSHIRRSARKCTSHHSSLYLLFACIVSFTKSLHGYCRILRAESDISNLSKFRRLKKYATQANVSGLVKVTFPPPKNAYCHEDILMQDFRQKSPASWFLKESKLPSNLSWKMPRVLTFNLNVYN